MCRQRYVEIFSNDKYFDIFKTMRLVSYYDLTAAEHKQFCLMLRDAKAETKKQAGVNMWSEDPMDQNTLLYLLTYTDRFRKNGQYQILFDQENAVACSGCYTSEFSNQIAILGVRTWVQKNYRNKLISREFLLPAEKTWALKTGHSAGMLTFNEYNKNLMQLFLRKRLGVTVSPRTERYFGYTGVHAVDYPITVQFTKQYVIYEKFDPQFEFDWSAVKYNNTKITSL
jgi:hypothetical protein